MTNFEKFKDITEKCKAKPILSREERDFCEVIGDGYIARDKDERLWIHAFEPTKNVNKKEWESRYHYFELICSKFSFIRWEDAEPWDVQDLLKLEVEE